MGCNSGYGNGSKSDCGDSENLGKEKLVSWGLEVGGWWLVVGVGDCWWNKFLNI